jgi:phospholipid-binding lipoprotein MlaA
VNIKLSLSLIFLSFNLFSSDVQDPLEDLNRKIFNFNESLDNSILKPTAEIYRSLVPMPAKKGITNFFKNISEVDNSINQLLQGKPKESISDLSRFLINSTFGLFGLIDVASSMGLERHNEDFGQTLGVWGVSSGPYLMLPFLGPTSLRNVVTSPVSSFLSGKTAINEDDLRFIVNALDIIETRERLLDAETLLIGDKYNFVKDAYSQSRIYEINDGENVEDEFLEDFDDLYLD